METSMIKDLEYSDNLSRRDLLELWKQQKGQQKENKKQNNPAKNTKLNVTSVPCSSNTSFNSKQSAESTPQGPPKSITEIRQSINKLKKDQQEKGKTNSNATKSSKKEVPASSKLDTSVLPNSVPSKSIYSTSEITQGESNVNSNKLTQAERFLLWKQQKERKRNQNSHSQSAKSSLDNVKKSTQPSQQPEPVKIETCFFGNCLFDKQLLDKKTNEALMAKSIEVGRKMFDEILKDSATFPGVANQAYYWIRRAELEEKYGNYCLVVEIYEQASKLNAQHPLELVRGINNFVQRMTISHPDDHQELSELIQSLTDKGNTPDASPTIDTSTEAIIENLRRLTLSKEHPVKGCLKVSKDKCLPKLSSNKNKTPEPVVQVKLSLNEQPKKQNLPSTVPSQTKEKLVLSTPLYSTEEGVSANNVPSSSQTLVHAPKNSATQSNKMDNVSKGTLVDQSKFNYLLESALAETNDFSSSPFSMKFASKASSASTAFNKKEGSNSFSLNSPSSRGIIPPFLNKFREAESELQGTTPMFSNVKHPDVPTRGKAIPITSLEEEVVVMTPVKSLPNLKNPDVGGNQLVTNVRRSSRLLRNSKPTGVSHYKTSGVDLPDSLDERAFVFSPNPKLKQDVLKTPSIVFEIPSRNKDLLESLQSESPIEDNGGEALYVSLLSGENETNQTEPNQLNLFEEENEENKDNFEEDNIQLFDEKEELTMIEEEGEYKQEEEDQFQEEELDEEEKFQEELDEEEKFQEEGHVIEPEGEDQVQVSNTPHSHKKRIRINESFTPRTPTFGRFDTLVPFGKTTNKKLRNICWSGRRKNKPVRMTPVRRSSRIVSNKSSLNDPFSTPGEKYLVENKYLNSQFVDLPEGVEIEEFDS